MSWCPAHVFSGESISRAIIDYLLFISDFYISVLGSM